MGLKGVILGKTLGGILGILGLILGVLGGAQSALDLKNQLEEGTQDRGFLGGFWGRDIRKYWGLRPQYSVIGPPRIPPRCPCPGSLPTTGFREEEAKGRPGGPGSIPIKGIQEIEGPYIPFKRNIGNIYIYICI